MPRGRPKGSPNRVPRALKEMILAALDQAGGEQYLKEQATDNPIAFLTLIGKVLPLTISNAPGEDFRIATVTRRIIDGS